MNGSRQADACHTFHSVVFSEPPGYFLETSFKGPPEGPTEVRVVQNLSPLALIKLPPDVRMLRGIALQAKYSAFVYPASNEDYERIESRLISEEEDQVRSRVFSSGCCAMRVG